MASNFLHVEVGKDASNKWRNIVSVVLILVAISGGIVWYRMPPSHAPTQADQVAVVDADTAVISDTSDALATTAGGDITQPPPPNIAPTLPLLEGALVPEGELSALSAIVKDRETGVILYAKHEYEPRSIASLTKLMSALVILEAGPDWDKEVDVSPDDVIDTHMYAGETYTMESLWRAALVASSNKAVLSLVDGLEWPREAFVERMNKKAVELGMTKTHFVEPTGLDAGNTSTAADIALLLDEALRVNEIRQTLLLSEYHLVSVDKEQRHHMWNTNWLLLGWVNNQFYDLRGGKTGYIPASGYNFAMQVAGGDGEVLSVVVLGAEDHEARFTEARDIAMSVFENYAWPEHRVAGEKIEQ